MLAQVLHYYVTTQNEAINRFVVIGSAVLAITETLFLLELRCAGWTAPSYKSRSKLNKVRELMLILVEFFDEI